MFPGSIKSFQRRHLEFRFFSRLFLNFFFTLFFQRLNVVRSNFCLDIIFSLLCLSETVIMVLLIHRGFSWVVQLLLWMSKFPSVVAWNFPQFPWLSPVSSWNISMSTVEFAPSIHFSFPPEDSLNVISYVSICQIIQKLFFKSCTLKLSWHRNNLEHRGFSWHCRPGPELVQSEVCPTPQGTRRSGPLLSSWRNLWDWRGKPLGLKPKVNN